MAVEPKTPQEKKRLSYEKDRRNTYGENSKASRKGIPLAKARSNRAERHTLDNALSTAVGLANSDALAAVEILFEIWSLDTGVSLQTLLWESS